MTEHVPDAEDAVAIVRDALHTDVTQITRFATGLAHVVYDVRTGDGRALVVRLTRPAQRWMFEGALYWHERLAPLGVPLPQLLHVDLAATGGFPVMIMARIQGTDLGIVYPTLSRAEKRRIAHEIVRIQRIVGSLPRGRGFGFATSYDDPRLRPTWTDVIVSSLNRSRERIEAVGIVDPRAVEQLCDRVHAFADQLNAIEPRCFLDDTTTKNVIVEGGVLRGIVDVDMACFGDPLFTVALTRMSLLASSSDTDYIDEWCAALELNPDRTRLLDLYTAVFCVDFLGEQGQQFNKAVPPTIDREQVRHLERILAVLVATT